MIDIDIQSVKPMLYGTTADITISRIGDVVFLEKKSIKDFSSCRLPWQEIFLADKLEIIGGSRVEEKYDILRFFVEDYDSNIILKFFKNKKVNLAVLQGGLNYSLCAITGKFCGYKVNMSEAVFDFKVDKSEMIYKK